MLDCTQMTYDDLADLVRAVRDEVAKNRFANHSESVHFNKLANTVIDALDSYSEMFDEAKR